MKRGGTVGLRITLDGSQMNREIAKSRRELKALGDEVMMESRRMESAFSGIGRSLTAVMGGMAVKGFAQKVVETRGEIQQLEAAFTTMLGSVEKSGRLMAELTELAATTPFEMTDVAGGAKQLLAYGMEAENIVDTLRRLGDVAAGLSIPMGDLAYLYGTTMVQGRLYTQDFNQFLNRGIPLVGELAKQFGVAESEVKGLVESGRVGFPEIEKAIKSMTDEGGKFGGLMAAQSKTIAGQISNIEDAISQMFNEIGKSSEGMINLALSGVSTLIEHYEAIGTALGIIAASYGLNKAALALHAAMSVAMADQEMAAYARLLPVRQAVAAEDVQAMAASRGLTTAKMQEVLAMKAQVSAYGQELSMRAANLASLKAEITTRMEKMSAQIAMTEMQIAVAAEERASAIASNNLLAANSAGERINRAENTKTMLVERQKSAATALNNVEIQINTVQKQQNTIATGLNTGANYANVTSVNVLTAAYGLLKKGLVAVSNFMKANPYLLIAAAVVTAAYGIFQMSTALSNEEQAARAAGDAIAKLNEQIDDLKSKTQSQLSVLNSETALISEKVKAYQALKDTYPELLENMSMEQLSAMNNVEAQKLLNKELEKTRLEKAKQLLEDRKNETYEDQVASWWNEKDFWEIVKDIHSEGEWYEHLLGYGVQASGIRNVKKHNAEMRKQLREEAEKIQKEQEDAAWLELPVTVRIDVLTKQADDLQQKLNDARNELNDEINSRFPNYERIEILRTLVFDYQVKLEEKNKEKASLLSGPTVAEQRKIWQNELKKAQKELKALTADNAIYDEKSITETKATIADLEKKLGISKTDSTNKAKKQAEERKKAEENAGKQLLSIQQQIARDEIELMQEGHKKKMAQIALEYKEQKTRIEQQVKELADLNKKAGTTGLNGKGLTAEQQKAIDETERLNNEKRKNAINELLKEEIMALDEYLHEYGTYEQRKAAISRLYAEKIEKSSTNGERLMLEAELEREAGKIEAERMLDSVNMASVFEDFGLILTEPLRQSVDELRRYTETDAFRSRSFEEQQSIYEAIARAEQAMNGIGGLNFNEVGYAVATYNNALAERLTAETALAEAERSLRNAQEELNEAIRNGDEAAQEAAQSQYEAAEQAYANARSDYSRANSKVAQTQTAANKSLAKFNDTLSKIDGTVRELYNGSLKAIWDLLGNKFHTKMGALVSGTLELTTQFDGLNKVLRDNGSSVADFAESLSAALGKLSGLSVENVSEKGSAAISEQFAAQFDNPEMYSAVSDTLSGKFTEIFNTALQNGSSVQEATEQAASGIGELIQNIGKAGESTANLWGAIIGLVLQLLDEFGEHGLGRFVGTLLENIGEAVSGILGNLLTDFVPQVINGIGDILVGVVDGVLNLLTFGGAGSFKDAINEGFGLSNASKVKETIERLTERNELLTVAIESLTEEMKVSRGTQSVEVYRRLRDYQAEVNKNYLAMAKAQSGYYGSHHSWGRYWRESGGFTDEEIARMSKAIGRSWDGSLWSLSPEEMEILRSFPDIWKRMQDAGKGDYGKRVTDKLDDYIEQAGKLEELQDQLYEGLTGISFESMYDSFVDSLMDMKYGAKDAAEDISEYFTRAMLSNKIGDLMADDLENWWKRFGAAMENDGTLSETEREALLEEYMGYMDEAVRWRDEIFAATGYSSEDPESQDSTRKGFATASQDSIDELNGRFTGVQMAVEEIKTQNTLMAADVHGVRLDMAMIRQHTDEMRGLSLAAVNHLADISRNTYQLYEMNERLALIEKNTRAL